jgi:hypothetical protein
MTPNGNWQPNDDFLGRVKAAYLAAGTPQQDYPWAWIDHRRRPVHDALVAPDNAAIRAIFADPASTDLFYGVDNLFPEVIAQISANPEADAYAAQAIRSDILILLDAIGLQPIPYEDRPLGEIRELEVETSLQQLDRALRQRVEFPNPFRGEVGLSTERGTASFRAIQALYQAWRVQQLLNRSDRRTVLEIGPGIGRTAYYASKAGAHYTTLDLPLGVIAQACFLGATLGPGRIWLFGEDPKSASGKIRLFPSTMMGSIKDNFAVILNVDSMTEMGQQAASELTRWIGARGAAFLSINHEANGFTVKQLAESHFADDSLVSRSPYWMRRGYVEELYVQPRRRFWRF